MKMQLKNKKLRFGKINFDFLNKKNYFIFLVSLFIIGLFSGILFFCLVKGSVKQNILDEVNNFFTLKDNYNYLNILLSYTKSNIFNFLLIWFLGISIIGIIVILFLYFINAFSLGFIISGIIYSYGFKGIIGSICYIFPSKILYLITLLILTFFGCLMGINLIRNILNKESNSNNLSVFFLKYLKILFISLIFAILIALFDTFITPFMIKAFTFLIK